MSLSVGGFLTVLCSVHEKRLPHKYRLRRLFAGVDPVRDGVDHGTAVDAELQ
jgi:hypothetical protein